MDKSNQTPIRVALYLRVSTAEQTERYGIDLQKHAVMSMIDSRAGSDTPFIFAGKDHVYIDDLSGTTPLAERPAFGRMMEDVLHAPAGQRPFDAIAVYKIDRFARKLNILLDAISFFETTDIQFMSVNESIDTSTPFGRAMLSIIGVIAELERDTIKDRTSAGRIAAIKKGVHMGTSAKYGYIKNERKQLQVCEEEAGVVRMIFELYVVQKKSVYEIADFLTESKYLIPEASALKHRKHGGKGKAKGGQYKWHPENIRRLLKDDLYAGRAYYGKTQNGKKLSKAEWMLQPVPAIVDDLTFSKAQRISDESKRQVKETKTKHTYLLSGLLKCDHCKSEHVIKSYAGTFQKVKSTGDKAYYYICKGKGHLYRGNKCQTLPLSADAIEDYVVNLCQKMLSNPLHTYKYQRSLESTKVQVRQLQREEKQLLTLISDMPARRERLRDQHEVGIIDKLGLQKGYDELVQSEKDNRRKLEEVRAQLAQNTLDAAYIGTFKLFDEKYRNMLQSVATNREEAYKLLHLLVDQIIVYSRPVKESERVAGPKKEGQMSPYRIHVKFKLPQDMLSEIGAQKEYTTEKAPDRGASSGQKDISGGR